MPRVHPDLFSRYLRLLGAPARRPGMAALTELVQAQLTRVPFENISKVLQRKHDARRDLPGFTGYLKGIERYHFGGTCYANNFYFHCLLEHLGYQVTLCGADMTRPDVHLVSLVRLEEKEYLIDVGYAAPFLAPLPRDLMREHVLTLGRDRYVLEPRDENGRSRLVFYRGGRLEHGYTVNPTPRRIGHFKQVIADSFAGDATFMNALLLVRFEPGRSVRISNFEVTHSEGTTSRTERLESPETLAQTVERHFSIPRALAAEALSELGDLQDAWT